MINKNIIKNLLPLSVITAGLLGSLALSPVVFAADAAKKDEKMMTLEPAKAPVADNDSSKKKADTSAKNDDADMNPSSAEDDATDTDMTDSAADSAADSVE